MMDIPRQWNRFDFAFLCWDHAIIFMNLVRSLLDISVAHRVPSVIFNNFCHCSSHGRGTRYTDHVTPLMASQIPCNVLTFGKLKVKFYMEITKRF